MNISTDNIVFQEIVEAINDKQCILFLGAGVNAPSNTSMYSYPTDFRVPLSKELSSLLATEANYMGSDKENLQRVSQHFELEYGRWRLNKTLNKHLFTNKRPSPLLLGLAELDFPLIITTNFDRLLESSLRAFNKEPNVIVYEKDPKRKTVKCTIKSAENPTIFKIHGDIFIPGEKKDDDSAVITDEDYIHFIMRMMDREDYDPVPRSISEKLIEWPILFIGYRLLDYNLRLLFKVLRWRKNCFPPGYSIDPSPDAIVRRIFEEKKHALFLAQDGWNFIPQLYKEIKKKEMPNYYEHG